MKNLVLFSISILIINNLSFSQSPLSILGKTGGQLIQNLSKDNTMLSIGKAIEAAGDMKYEIEKIKAQNTKEIIIKTNPDDVLRVFPAEGYRWKNKDDVKDLGVEKLGYSYNQSIDLANELFERGYKDVLAGDWENALSLFSQSIEMSPNPLAYLLRGLLYCNNGKYEMALEDIGTLFNYNVSDDAFEIFFKLKGFILSSMDKAQDAIPLFNKSIELLQKTSSDISDFCYLYGLRGDAKSKVGDFQGALVDLNKSIELCPKDEMGYFYRAGTKGRMNDLHGCLLDYNLALERVQQNNYVVLVSILAMKSAVCIELLDHKQAIQCANEAINIYENNNLTIPQIYKICYYMRGKAKIELGATESGCSDLRKAVQFGIDSNDGYYSEHCK